MTQTEFEQLLKSLMNESLNEEDIKILDCRYGLSGQPSSIKKAEKILEIPASQIRKIESLAIQKIQNSHSYPAVVLKLEKEDLDSFAINGLAGYYLLALQILR